MTSQMCFRSLLCMLGLLRYCQAILWDGQLASLACARPRVSVCFSLDYSSLAMGEGTLWTLGASMMGSILADLV